MYVCMYDRYIYSRAFQSINFARTCFPSSPERKTDFTQSNERRFYKQFHSQRMDLNSIIPKTKSVSDKNGIGTSVHTFQRSHFLAKYREIVTCKRQQSAKLNLLNANLTD